LLLECLVRLGALRLAALFQHPVPWFKRAITSCDKFLAARADRQTSPCPEHILPREGCGPGVYVPQKQVESEVLNGVAGVLGGCSDPKGFTAKVNAELRRLWEDSTGFRPDAAAQIAAIDKKIANVHQAIEDGLQEAAWANARLSTAQGTRRARRRDGTVWCTTKNRCERRDAVQAEPGEAGQAGRPRRTETIAERLCSGGEVDARHSGSGHPLPPPGIRYEWIGCGGGFGPPTFRF